MYIKPKTVNIKPIPRSGPIPNTLPNESANNPPSSSGGEKTFSETGPLNRYAIGIIEYAIIRRTEKTRP